MVESIQAYENSKYSIFHVQFENVFGFSGKEKVLGVTPQRFDSAARDIMKGLRSGRNPILLPPLQLQITRILRA